MITTTHSGPRARTFATTAAEIPTMTHRYVRESSTAPGSRHVWSNRSSPIHSEAAAATSSPWGFTLPV